MITKAGEVKKLMARLYEDTVIGVNTYDLSKFFNLVVEQMLDEKGVPTYVDIAQGIACYIERDYIDRAEHFAPNVLERHNIVSIARSMYYKLEDLYIIYNQEA